MHLSGTGLRELARRMSIPAGTVLAHAHRKSWAKDVPGNSCPPILESQADINADPKTELLNFLDVAQSALLEARSSLAMIKLYSNGDEHITRALTEIGHLRIETTENDL